MKILVNQLGYGCGMRKVAVLQGADGGLVQAVNAAGETVLTVPAAPAGEIWGDETALADFSALTAEGVYTLRCGEAVSRPFAVTAAPWRELLTALTDMFYDQRCGGEVDARAGVFAHPACHTGPARVWGTEEKREVTGGWHDAGDFGRYVVPAAKAVADLLLARQWHPAAFDKPGRTALMEEIRWELEWMLKMQREDGGVFHKVTCASFCGMIMPQEETEELILCPVSTTATGDFAACMAMASRHYADVDPAFSARMLEAAKRAWDFLDRTEPILFTNPKGIVTGEYGDDSDADERLWAHVELALACGEEKYLIAARKALAAHDRSAVILGWADVSGYAAIEGLMLPEDASALCRAWILGAAEAALARINPYGITMTDSLPWGSNMTVANDGMVFHQAWLLTGEDRYRAAAEKQVHYLLGVNAVDYCFVTAFGTKSVEHPHHRASVAQGQAQPGMLSGGPAGGLMDPCAAEHLQGQPDGKSFIDLDGSYSTNEICVYWNSPMVALVAGVTAGK